MLETGDGLAVFGVCGAIITGILKMVPKRNSNGIDKAISKQEEICDGKRKLVVIDIKYMKEKVDDTHTRLKVLETDTKEILKYVKMK